MKRLVLGLTLVAVWVMLWDYASLGQVVAGIVVAALLLVVMKPQATDGHDLVFSYRPLALARLGLWFGWQLVVSNIQVSRAVLFPDRYVRPGVVRVPLTTESPQLTALIANLTALSPGMQPVGTHEEPAAIDVHVLMLVSDEAVTETIHHLERLVVDAFPVTRRDRSRT